MVERRDVIKTLGGAALVGSLAGCGSSGGSDTETTTTTTTEAPTTTTTTSSGPTEVAVGPEKRLRFDPEAIEVDVGDTVRWTAMSVGHNVTSKPGASEKCRNPDGADPFASYEGENHYAIMDVDDTYEYTFEVPGDYVYVCAPHAGQGMVGEIAVTE